MEGIFAIYKPTGITSHDVIHRLRLATHVQRIGHAGTLDPGARGVLVVAIGRTYTKQLTSLILKDKEYLVDATFGAYSSTDDSEGEKTTIPIHSVPSRDEVFRAMQTFNGELYLRPPIFSAIKIRGQRAYSIARKGKTVELPKRKSIIYLIELLDYSWPYLKFRVVTGSGVYVRSIVRALGEILKTGAYVHGLERTRVGSFTKAHAIELDVFIRNIEEA
ncbi:MAG: tRNA pseudouridine(55) synthase TruB [Patescibacteria group bacterium]|jgi:tRNA pseudouridine55 synthase